MSNKMDGVNIPVNNISEASAEEKREKEIVSEEKKAIKPKVKKTKKQESNKVSEAKARKTETPGRKSPKAQGGFFQILISVAVTAVVVGGIVYALQSKTAEKKVEESKGETASIKSSLEEQLSSLNLKLTGFEAKEAETKQALDDLARKAALLIGAKKEYANADMGMSFEYPAAFGSITVATTTNASSTAFTAVFENNDKFVFGGVDKAYAKTSTDTVKTFELKGFVQKNNKYFVLGPNKGQEFEVDPAKVINFNSGTALLLEKKSFVISQEGDGLPVDIGENIMVVLNLKSGIYSAVSFVNSDFGMFSLQDFVKLIESVRID